MYSKSDPPWDGPTPAILAACRMQLRAGFSLYIFPRAPLSQANLKANRHTCHVGIILYSKMRRPAPRSVVHPYALAACLCPTCSASCGLSVTRRKPTSTPRRLESSTSATLFTEGLRRALPARAGAARLARRSVSDARRILYNIGPIQCTPPRGLGFEVFGSAGYESSSTTSGQRRLQRPPPPADSLRSA